MGFPQICRFFEGFPWKRQRVSAESSKGIRGILKEYPQNRQRVSADLFKGISAVSALFGRSLVLFVKRHLEIVLLIVGEVVTIPSKAKTLLICANVHLPSHWVQRATILPL